MILFDEIIFGPVNSRRLGVSLGINLLPVTSKYCNFNCIYCECGLSENSTATAKKLPTREIVSQMLNESLERMHNNHEKLDAITFAGNGEPTIHPSFEGIIDDTILARNKYFPEAVITVLSNATMLHKESVFNALKKIT
jgi:wyosine [tRNA(Phe)-imidazoG37] synthetase (radical SAM superfamily)